MFSWSFFRSHLVHGMIVVSVVMSSMYALMGERRRPALSCWPLATHLEARIMTSIAMVKARREMWATTLKKILASMFKRVTWRNWLMSAASFSLGKFWNGLENANKKRKQWFINLPWLVFHCRQYEHNIFHVLSGQLNLIYKYTSIPAIQAFNAFQKKVVTGAI